MNKKVHYFTFIAIITALMMAATLAACQPKASDSEVVARPSNPGGPGEAINLTGDATRGADIFKANCAFCHGDQGAGGTRNPGSTDGTIPALNPIDESLVSTDYKTYATNIDLFIENGSTPAGPNPIITMMPWGGLKTLSPQQIADVIAYVIGLNQTK
jgi:mono/diheme cytochrome c family protein